VSEVSSKLDGIAYFFAPLLLEGQVQPHPQGVGRSLDLAQRTRCAGMTRVRKCRDACGLAVAMRGSAGIYYAKCEVDT
jgi:hypothetical protein